MGMFDFLKPKTDPLAKVLADPKVNRVLLHMKLEQVSKRVESLMAVGREEDALKVLMDYLGEIIKEWSKKQSDPEWLMYHTNVALSFAFESENQGFRFAILHAAKETLKIIIEENQKTPFTDLTPVYFDLGRIYHQLRVDPNKELWAYHMATEAQAPLGNPFPATKYQKAKAHHFASMCAYRAQNQEHIDWHTYKAKELAPELDWNDKEAVVKWIARNK